MLGDAAGGINLLHYADKSFAFSNQQTPPLWFSSGTNTPGTNMAYAGTSSVFSNQQSPPLCFSSGANAPIESVFRTSQQYYTTNYKGHL